MIMAIAGIKPHISKDLLWKFLIAAKPFMTIANRDGVGYAAMGRKGLWGERWTNPNMAWKLRPKDYSEKDETVRKKYEGALEKDVNYNAFGTADPNHTSAVIYHTRMATCDKNMGNTHPFVNDKTALIHNGVVQKNAWYENKTSTCDSESILNEYVKDNVTENPMRIHTLSDHTSGYYGVAVLTTNKEGKEFLDIFRYRANIYACYIDQLETTVFCTSDDVIRNTCKDLNMTYGHMFKLKEELFLRIDVKTGLKVTSIPFKYFNNSGYTFAEEKVEEKKSLAIVKKLEEEMDQETYEQMMKMH